jgi:hypothetical protein
MGAAVINFRQIARRLKTPVGPAVPAEVRPVALQRIERALGELVTAVLRLLQDPAGSVEERMTISVNDILRVVH